MVESTVTAPDAFKSREVRLILADGSDWRQYISKTTGVGPKLNVDPEVWLPVPENFSYSYTNDLIAPVEGILDQISEASPWMKMFSMGRAAIGESDVFNPWIKYAKAWKKTEPISISFEFNFKIGQYGLWNATKEVLKPILNLAVLGLPASISGSNMRGPYVAAPEMLVKVLNGLSDDALKILKGEKPTSISKFFETVADSPDSYVNMNNTITVMVGKFFELKACYVKSSTINFSSQVDTDGIPIGGSVSLSLEGSRPPTKENTANTLSGFRFYTGS